MFDLHLREQLLVNFLKFQFTKLWTNVKGGLFQAFLLTNLCPQTFGLTSEGGCYW